MNNCKGNSEMTSKVFIVFVNLGIPKHGSRNYNRNGGICKWDICNGMICAVVCEGRVRMAVVVSRC